MTTNAPISRRSVSSALLGALAAGCVSKSFVADDASHAGGAAPAASPAASPAAAPPAAAPVAAAPPPAAPTPPPPPPPVAFDEAVNRAAIAVFTAAPAPDAGGAMVVIDPLIDGVTGYQSKATQTIQDRIT